MKNFQVVDLDQVRSILRENRAEISNRFKTEILGIFGSYSRGEASSTSDIDLLVRFEKGASLFGWAGLVNYLEDKLSVSVDVVPEKTLKKELREQVFRDLIEL
jgi:predicted nucleotidyltransferase